MEKQDSQDMVQSLYLSLLGRAGDPEGLQHWVEELENSSIDTLGDSFTRSSEFMASTAAESPDGLVRSLYFNMFDRQVDKAGLDYWSTRLEQGDLDEHQLMKAITNSASDADREAYNAKLAIADYYTGNISQDSYDPEQPLTLSSLHSNDELYADLQRLDNDYDSLALDQVGTSLAGNPLYKAEVGSGEKTVMIITQQHGDEPLGTEASLYLLEFLAGDSTLAQSIRENVTVTVMPRVNPDGFARWERQESGEQGMLDPRRNEADIDLNRSYDPDEGFDASQAPGAAAVLQVIDAFQPDLLLDYHHQNNYRSDADSLDTMSIRWPTNPDVDQSVSETGQQAAVAIANSLQEFDHDQLTLFPGSDNPAIARNGLALDGTPTLLIEQRGLQEMDELALGLDLDYSALASALTLEALISMKGVLSAIADDTFDSLDPALTEQIPERSERIDYADLYGDDAYQPETQDAVVSEELQLVGAQTMGETTIG